MEKRKNGDMAAIGRGPLQGVLNIVRFNWHFYVLAVLAAVLLLLFRPHMPGWGRLLAGAALLGITWNTFVSLLISWYVYDCTSFYSMDWLRLTPPGRDARVASIHAGFDETTAILAGLYPRAQVTAYDFYDPARHTEVSIKRARAAYPAYPGTVAISTNATGLAPGSFRYIFVMLAAHEIRDSAERQQFFVQLRQSLEPGGTIVVAEHLRDVPNFLAYTIGFFHFLSRAEWRRTFAAAGLKAVREERINPLITVFYLHDGTAS